MEMKWLLQPSRDTGISYRGQEALLRRSCKEKEGGPLLLPKCSYRRETPPTPQAAPGLGSCHLTPTLLAADTSPTCIYSHTFYKNSFPPEKKKTVQSTQHSHMTVLLLSVTDSQTQELKATRISALGGPLGSGPQRCAQPS